MNAPHSVAHGTFLKGTLFEIIAKYYIFASGVLIWTFHFVSTSPTCSVVEYAGCSDYWEYQSRVASSGSTKCRHCFGHPARRTGRHIVLLFAWMSLRIRVAFLLLLSTTVFYTSFCCSFTASKEQPWMKIINTSPTCVAGTIEGAIMERKFLIALCIRSIMMIKIGIVSQSQLLIWV